ncbi:MAG TPA: hypothetical protein VKS44_17000 [Candidatus Acidoferrales bacterium]|nr:hypothetical protein [Candidatus Acidoferrales bacterium]
MAWTFAAAAGATLALTLLAAPGFAQRAGGGAHSGGGGGGSHVSAGAGSRSGGGRASIGGRSVGGESHTYGIEAPSRPAASGVSRSEATGSASVAERVTGIVRSAETSGGNDPWPGKPAEGATASRGFRLAEPATHPRDVTIGFPPRTSHGANISSEVVRRGAIVISGQTNYLWADPPSTASETHSRVAIHGGGETARPANLDPARVGGSRSAKKLEFMTDSSAKGSSRNSGWYRIAPAPPHWFEPRHRRHHEPIFGGFGFFGGGFGVPFFGFALIPDCAPLWDGTLTLDCTPLGYWDGSGSGFTDDSGRNYVNGNQEEDQQDVESQERNPGTYGTPPQSPTEDGQNVPQEPLTALWAKDGTSYAVTSYWLADGKLHYVTSYGGEDAIGMDELDLQRTVDANASQGVGFVLRPRPKEAFPDQPQPPR